MGMAAWWHRAKEGTWDVVGRVSAFRWMLAGVAGLTLSTYVRFIGPGDAGLFEGLTAAGMLGIWLAILVLAVLCWVCGVIRQWRTTPADQMRAIATMVLGFVVIHGLQRLAERSEDTYLAAMVGTVSSLLIALALDSRADRA